MAGFDPRLVQLAALYKAALQELQATPAGELLVQVSSIGEDADLATETTLQEIRDLLSGEAGGALVLNDSTTLLAGIPSDVVSVTVPTGYRFHGAQVSAHRYTRFDLYIGGILRATRYVTSDNPNADFLFPIPVPIAFSTDTLVAIRAENMSDQGSTEAHATLLVTP